MMAWLEEDLNDVDNIEMTNMDCIVDNISADSLQTYWNQHSNDTKKDKLSQNMIAAIELLSLLSVSEASLKLYDKIIYWTEERIPDAMNEAMPTREKG